jgi:hypothetical protein
VPVVNSQPVARLRLRSIERRQTPRISTILAVLAISALVFLLAFVAARSHGTAQPARHGPLPPGLPSLASPVPESLAAVPAIEVGVNGPQPARPRTPAVKPTSPSVSAPKPPSAAATQPRAPSAIVAPTATNSAPTSTGSAPTRTSPAITPPAHTPPASSAPNGGAPAGKAPSGRASPSGGGPGTSFESSG